MREWLTVFDRRADTTNSNFFFAYNAFVLFLIRSCLTASRASFLQSLYTLNKSALIEEEEEEEKIKKKTEGRNQVSQSGVESEQVGNKLSYTFGSIGVVFLYALQGSDALLLATEVT